MVRTIGYGRVGNAAAAAFMALLLSAYAVSPAKAGTRAAEAQSFIEDLAASGVAMLESSKYSETEREVEFRRITRRGFALDAVAQFVAGRHWRAMSDDQRAEFQNLFSEWLLTSYARRLGSYAGQRLEVINSFELQNKARDIVVRTRVVHTDGQPPVVADWRVREFAGAFKIIDVMIEGVSMATTQRTEFDSVIRKVGVEGLLANLRSRLAVLVAGAD